MTSAPVAAASARRRRRWSSLPATQRRAVIATALLVPITHVLLRIIDYRRTMALASWTAGRWPFKRTALHPPETVEAFRLASARVQHYSPLPGNCLSRSLVLWWQLQQRGLAPALRLGVSLAGGSFAAHAWVEQRGCVVNDTADVAERYRPFTGGT
jgi:hypothetical protein